MYAWREQEGELELVIDAPTREGVFEDALLAVGELTSAERGRGEPVKEVLVVEAAEPEALLAEWVSELVYLVRTADLVPERIDELALRPASLRAVVRGRRSRPVLHVDSVARDRLELRREPDGWHARLAVLATR